MPIFRSPISAGPSPSSADNLLTAPPFRRKMNTVLLSGLIATIMYTKRTLILSTAVVLSAFVGLASGQNLKRVATKNDKLDFGAGGTVAIVGAPNGSIRVRIGPGK